MLTRRHFLAASAALAARPAWAAASPALTVASRQIEVLGRAATVYGITNPQGGTGLFAREGDRFSGLLRNATADDLLMHWHGQVRAPADQDHTRPGGLVQTPGTDDPYDFELTPGTHWMHSHQLTEQQLLAAPMVTAEADATLPEATVMLHDFAFRSPAQILAELGASKMHDMAAMGTEGGHDMGGMTMAMPGMTHANDVTYDAFLANDRTLADPQVIAVEPGAFRLRIINGATATAFWIGTDLPAEVIAVDGNPCQPLPLQRLPLAQGQRVDLRLTIPAEGGAFPVLAQVEGALMRTGVILATQGAPISRLADAAVREAPYADLSLDNLLRAADPLPERAGRTAHILLGMGPNYQWSLDTGGPLQADAGERLEMMFMNTTMMMHPMHLHGHHFQVVDLGMGRFNGPRRDTVIVPPGGMVTVAVDLDKPGGWYLHCHHLYHMASGMMTTLTVA
jgi:FtsP/CotA-like multicopper oxidase with cupredoxin domain